jgi:uncharacterized protein (TIGR02300 family)
VNPPKRTAPPCNAAAVGGERIRITLFKVTELMAKPELGTKRVCPETGRKFYDLNKEPVISPYTGKVVPVEPLARARPEPVAARAAPAPVVEVATPEPAEAEFVSLEEADAEASGGAAKKPAAPAEAEIEEEEVEMDDEGMDDAAFIEEQEEEDTDVTDIIGSDRENEEEG